MKPPLRIAILECDTPLPGTKAIYGTYGGRFKVLFEVGADKLNQPDLISSKHGLEFSSYDVVHKMEYPSSLKDIDAVLLTGSKHDSFASYPWILKLVEYTRSLLLDQTRVRVIGVCFGHQIIGRALSAPVGRSDKGWEASLSRVELSALGSQLFAGKKELAIYQMHRDAVFSYPELELPDGGKVLALGKSDRCDVQGMYVRGRLISVQGHPEFNEPIVREILESRYKMGIFDQVTFDEMIGRVALDNDGVMIAASFLTFLLDDIHPNL